jgi:sarcosine oxidase
VLLLEQFELGHTRGASHGSSRIFRLNYPDESFVRLAQEADAAWRTIEAARDETLIERVGSLDLGPVAREIGRAFVACGVAFETLSAGELFERWSIQIEQDETAVYQADGGVHLADRSHAALLDDAARGGVEIRDRTRVRALSLGHRGVRLELDDGHVDARVVVVTSGAWATDLLADAGITLDVEVTSETVVYFDLPGAERLPPVIDYGLLPGSDEGGVVRGDRASYALAAPGVGLKAGVHLAGRVVDPNSDVEPDARLAAWVGEWVAARYPAAGDPSRAETCQYTTTPDKRFVLERHGPVVVGSACSGRGFKFAPVVGETLAGLALDAAA